MSESVDSSSGGQPAGPQTWVLLRGLTRETGHWGDFGQVLSAQLPGARVLAIDLPGNGRLNGLRSPIRIDAMTDHCRAQLQALGITPPFGLLAMSLGGMVAVDWAVRYPSELSGCVLINTSLRPFSPWHARLRPANLPLLLRLALTARTAREKEQVVLRMTSRQLEQSPAVLDHWTALRQARPVTAANALRQLLAAARYHAPSLAPGMPLLVLCSTCDGLVDAQCSRALAQHWSAPLVEHPSAGHDLPLDDGPWVAAQVSRWVAAGLAWR